jgi:hypothetical protein
MKKKQHSTKNNQLFSKFVDLRSQISDLRSILLFLFVTLLPTQLGKHFFFPISYLSGVRIDYLAPTLYLTDILAFILIVLHAKIILSVLRQRVILIILGLLLINVIFAITPPIAFYRYVKVLELLGIFIIFWKSHLSPKLLLVAFSLGATFELALATLQFSFKHSLQGLFYYFGERYITLSQPDIAKISLSGQELLRPYGTFSHPNSLGGFYLLVYMILLTTNLFDRYPLLKYVTHGITTILVFLSFSKVAVVTYIVLSSVYLFQNAFARRNPFVFVSHIVVTVAFGALIFTAQGDPLSGDKRVQLVKDALTIIWYYPLVGVGLGNYLVAQHGFIIKYPYFFLQPVHNILLLFIAETGLVLGGYILYHLVRFAKKQLNHRTIRPLLYCSGALLVTGLFDHYWLTLQQNFLLMAVIFGCIFSLGNSSAKLKKGP